MLASSHSPSLPTSPKLLASPRTATPQDGLDVVFRPGFLSSPPSPSLPYLEAESSTAAAMRQRRRPSPLELDASAFASANLYDGNSIDGEF
jgi:hypothetical protein